MRKVLRWFAASGCLAAAIASACGGQTSQPASDDDAGTDASIGDGYTGSSSGVVGGSSTGGSSSGSGSGSSGSEPDDASGSDATVGPTDGASGSSSGGGNLLDAAFDVTPPPTGQAGFAFVVNGVVLTPLSCPAYDWEFPAPAALPQSESGAPNPAAVCEDPYPPCPGISSALIVNTGQVPLAYTAETTWDVSGSNGYPPGVQFGDAMELSGVLNPGERVDISSIWLGGITAVVGASEPFSNMSHYVSDEGTIPWPTGVPGNDAGATTMYVAEINLVNSCHMPTIVW